MTGAKDRVWRREEPDSPCRAICLIDPQSRLCIGCNRTAEEIAAWPGMSRDERIAVLRALSERSPIAPRRKGGRARRIAERKDLPSTD